MGGVLLFVSYLSLICLQFSVFGLLSVVSFFCKAIWGDVLVYILPPFLQDSIFSKAKNSSVIHFLFFIAKGFGKRHCGL